MNEPENRAEAMKLMAQGLGKVSGDEAEFLKDLRRQIDLAVENDPGLDKQEEFCYGIIFAPDKVKNEKVVRAAHAYINASE